MILDERYTVCELDCDVNIGHIPTIKSAKLVYIKGKNMLKTRVHAISDNR